MRHLIPLVGFLLLTSCGNAGQLASSPTVTTSTPRIVVETDAALPDSGRPAGSCHAHQVGSEPDAWEPDPACTPGVLDPSLTTLASCAHTAARRPPHSYTDALKRRQLVEYGFAPGTFTEEDHLLPMELCGHPRDPRNLWPQPSIQGPDGRPHNFKDGLESWLADQVCSGRLTLAQAQQQILSGWYLSWEAAGKPSREYRRQCVST